MKEVVILFCHIESADVSGDIVVTFSYSDGKTFTTSYQNMPVDDEAELETAIRQQVRGTHGEENNIEFV